MGQVPTHPLWRPYELADLDEVAKVRLGGKSRPVTVVPYDEGWPARFAEVEALVRGALGERVLSLEHIGSTAVPGLAAKPVIDADLTVADSADEAAYLPDLEEAGFVLRIREPEWEEHRVFGLEAPMTNLHVWSPGSAEPQRHAAFRDWLRADEGDREAYAALKTELAGREFSDVMDYNNHKAALVYDIYERVFTADQAHPHDPQERPR
jgi:GrpB-like predicted nucleotidyltransferase (UPF0157 family)